MRDPQPDGYGRRGLQANPFVAEAAPGVDPRVFLDVGIPDPPTVGVIELVGCKGAGKTTHLLRWCAQRGGAYAHVPPVRPWATRLPAGRVVAWDEVDRYPAALLRARVAAARRRGSLVLLGTHVPTGLADRSHRLPAPTAAAVQAFAARRIAAAGRPDARTADLALPADLPVDLAADIAARSQGCWWRVGTALHVWAAQQVAGVGLQR